MIIETPVVGVNIYRNVYDCSRFVALAEKESSKDWPRLEWERSSEKKQVNDGHEDHFVSEYRSSLGMNMEPLMTNTELPDMKEIQDEFLDMFAAFDKCVWDYRNHYDLPLSNNEPMGLLKYSDGAEYRVHWDSGPVDGRVLSYVAYMNDGYEGGELEFPLLGYTYTPQAGDLLLFPSNYIYRHAAKPVMAGTKYSLVTWFK